MKNRYLANLITTLGRTLLRTADDTTKRLLHGTTVVLTQTTEDERKENTYVIHYNLYYGDTDSIMIGFGKVNRNDAAAIAQFLEEYYVETGVFRNPHVLEFEHLYTSAVFVIKKKYAALAKEAGFVKILNYKVDDKIYIEYKVLYEPKTVYKSRGMSKRDIPEAFRYHYNETIMDILNGRNYMDRVTGFIKQLLLGEVPIKDLICTKNLKDSYKVNYS